jgi:hypothetical protein
MAAKAGTSGRGRTSCLGFSKNGTWIGNPAAGTGGFASGNTSFTPFVGPYDADVLTGRFTAASQTYAAPSGFSAWDASAVGGTTYNDNLTESAVAADGLATTVTWGPALAENAAAADSVSPAGSTFGVPLSESAAAADALGVGLVMPVSASESVAAGDAVTSSQTFVDTLGESAVAADSLSGGLSLGVGLVIIGSTAQGARARARSSRSTSPPSSAATR